jgi:hypothetical protein
MRILRPLDQGYYFNSTQLFERASTAYNRCIVSDKKRKSDVLDVIIFSVASGEAFINELIELASVSDNNKFFTEEIFKKLPDYNEEKIEVYKKFRISAKILRIEINEKSNPLQRFKNVVDLRNNIIHRKLKPASEKDPIKNIPKDLLFKVDAITDWFVDIQTKEVAKWAIDGVSEAVEVINQGVQQYNFSDCDYIKYTIANISKWFVVDTELKNN